jgi:hypothetical protein
MAQPLAQRGGAQGGIVVVVRGLHRRDFPSRVTLARQRRGAPWATTST